MAGTVLVFGANGHVGAPLVKLLMSRGVPVRAASRSGKAAACVEGVSFELGGTASPDAVLDGVEALYLLMPGGDLRIETSLIPVIESAARLGVRVVLQTALGVDADETIPYRKVERALERSGAPYVILRPNWFSDNFHTFWIHGVREGVIRLPAGAGKTSFIDTRDIAASAAAALASSRFDGRAFNLTGPAALGYDEAAAVLAGVTGRPVRYEPISDDAFIAAMVAAEVSEDYARFLTTIFHPVREGWAAGVTDDVRLLSGAEPLSLERYAQDNAAALRG